MRKKDTTEELFARILNKRSLMIFTLLVVISAIWVAPILPMKAVDAKKSSSHSKLNGLFGGSSSSSGRGSSRKSLTQTPSEPTDFPGYDHKPFPRKGIRICRL